MLGYASERELCLALSAQTGWSAVVFDESVIRLDVLEHVSLEWARIFNALVVYEDREILVVAAARPEDAIVPARELASARGKPVELRIALDITLATGTQIYSTPPNAALPTVTVKVFQDSYRQSSGFDAQKNATVQTPPGLGAVLYARKNTIPVTAGTQDMESGVFRDLAATQSKMLSQPVLIVRRFEENPTGVIATFRAGRPEPVELRAAV